MKKELRISFTLHNGKDKCSFEEIRRKMLHEFEIAEASSHQIHAMKTRSVFHIYIHEKL